MGTEQGRSHEELGWPTLLPIKLHLMHPRSPRRLQNCAVGFILVESAGLDGHPHYSFSLLPTCPRWRAGPGTMGPR